MQEKKWAREVTELDTRIYPVVSMTCRSPLIHVEVESMNQPLLYQEPLDLEPAWIKEPLQTSIPLELLFTTPMRWAQDLSQPKSGLLNNLLGGAPRNPLLKPSRERQLPRVTSWWRLLEVSLMPQSSNSWCNALGSSHTLKNAISKQVCVREGCLSSNVSRMLSKWPRETPNGRALGIYRHPFKN